MRVRLFFLFLLICGFINAQEKRLALVIGNANYDKGALKNPVNDAFLMKETFEKLGFDVILKTNVETRTDFINVVEEYNKIRKNYTIGFVYYAGHGVQIGGDNYLLPTKELYETENHFKYKGVPISIFTDEWDNPYSNEVNVLILDACRNNPLEKQIFGSTRNIIDNGGLGLAEMKKEKQPSGSIVAFSTAAGQTASDGKTDEKNSFYCKSLAKNMLLVDVSIRNIFGKVSKEIYTETKQYPEVSDKMFDVDFYLTKSTYADEIVLIDSLIEEENYDLALEKVAFIFTKSPDNKKALLRRGRIEYKRNLEYNGLHLFKADSLYPNDQEVNQYIARFYATIGDKNKAINNINHAIKLDGSNPDNFMWRAVFYSEQNKQVEALQDYTKAIELDNKNGRRYYERALFYEEYLEDYDNALIEYSKAIELDPTNIDFLYARGVCYTDIFKKNNKAREDFNMILTLDPNNINTINYLGLIFEDEENYDLAINQFEKGIALEKTNPTSAAFCYSNRAEIYAQQGKLTEALQDYTKAIELDDKNGYRYYSRALFYEEFREDYIKALDDYSKAIELDPTDLDFLYRRANLFDEHLERRKNAIEDYETMLSIDPEDIDAINSLGLILKKDERFELAINQFEKGIALEKTNPNSAAYCYSNRAEIYVQQGKLTEALQDYTKAIELDNKNGRKYYKRAIFYEEFKEDYIKALDDYSKAIELDPTDLDFLYRRANLFDEHLERRKNAIEDYETMLSIDPEDIDAINSLGLILKKDERFELAINQFEKGIALAKKNPISAAFCVNNRAAIYAQQGKLEKALQDYTMAIELDPTNATRYESRSEFHYTFEHSVEEALEDLIRAIELDPNNERYYYLRGYFYTELKKYDLAIESYQQALRINPGMIDAINNIGVIYEQQGKTELEIENYNKCIALENTNPNSAANCYYNRARIYEQQRKLTEALQDYTKAIELDNKNGDMYSTRALFYEEYLEDYDNALIDFSKAIELAPTNVNYLYQRGVFYKETLNKNKKALDDFEKILEIDSTDIDALNYIGVILEDEGKYDLAITQYEKGIALEITNPTSAAYCYFNRADIYAKQGKLTEALQDYTKAIELDPKNAEHYFYRAEFYTNNLNKPYDALVDYSIAINKDSLATYFWWNRGKLYSEKLNNQKLAIEDFDQILKIKPNDINALNWRTIFHQRNNEIENAILGYKKIISFGDSIKKLENIIEDYGWANINLAYIYQCIDKIEEASNLFNEGVSYMPNYAEGYYYRAWFLTLYKSQFDGAINDFSTSMNLEPNNPYWLLNRSKIYHLKGDFKRAKSDINEAVKISKESAIYIAERGNYYSITGEYDKATKEIKESLKLDSTNRRTFHYLTENLIRQGKLDEALKNATTTITKFKNDTISLEQIGRINFSKNELFKSLSAYTEAASIMEFNEGFRYIYPHDIQVFLSDVDIKIAEIYEKLNQSDLQCEFLNKAKDIVIFETRPDRQKMIKEIQEKLKNCQN